MKRRDMKQKLRRKRKEENHKFFYFPTYDYYYNAHVYRRRLYSMFLAQTANTHTEQFYFPFTMYY